MAEDNIKEFTINWIIVGLLMFSLISFTLTFMYNNNPLGLDSDSQEILGSSQSSISTRLYKTPNDADKVLNITATTNPEVGELGSRDSVATAYSLAGTGKGFFESLKLFISWIIVGDMGKMLLAVFGGIIGASAGYYIFKYIRNGI